MPDQSGPLSSGSQPNPADRAQNRRNVVSATPSRTIGDEVGHTGAGRADRPPAAARRGRIPDGHRLVASWGVHHELEEVSCYLFDPRPPGALRIVAPPERTTGAEPEPWPPDDRTSLNRRPYAGSALATRAGRCGQEARCSLGARARDTGPAADFAGSRRSARHRLRSTRPSRAQDGAGIRRSSGAFAASRSRNASEDTALQRRYLGWAIRPDGSLKPGIARHSIHHENRIHRIARSCCWHPHVAARQNDELSVAILIYHCSNG